MQSSCLFPRNSSSLNTKFKVAGRRIRKEKSKNDLRTNVVALFPTNHFAMRIGLAPPGLPWHLFLLAKRKSLWSIVAFGVWNPSFVPTRLFGTELFPSPPPLSGKPLCPCIPPSPYPRNKVLGAISPRMWNGNKEHKEMRVSSLYPVPSLAAILYRRSKSSWHISEHFQSEGLSSSSLFLFLLRFWMVPRWLKGGTRSHGSQTIF